MKNSRTLRLVGGPLLGGAVGFLVGRWTACHSGG